MHIDTDVYTVYVLPHLDYCLSYRYVKRFILRFGDYLWTG